VSGVPGQQTTKATELPSRYDEGFLDGLDGRFRIAREVRDRLAVVHADLGGEAHLSYLQRSLAKRYVWLELHHEADEARLARGEAVNLGAHVQRLNSMIGVARILGIERQRRPLNGDRLSELLEGR
jgi:hypothetical protein